MQEVETAVAGSAKVTGGAVISTLIFGFTANEVAVLGSLVVAFLGLLTNIWFQHKRNKLLEMQYKGHPEQETIDKLAREGKIERRKKA